jgi:hypothetical protein
MRPSPALHTLRRKERATHLAPPPSSSSNPLPGVPSRGVVASLPLALPSLRLIVRDCWGRFLRLKVGCAVESGCSKSDIASESEEVGDDLNQVEPKEGEFALDFLHFTCSPASSLTGHADACYHS